MNPARTLKHSCDEVIVWIASAHILEPPPRAATRAIKDDTGALREESSQIKQDTAAIRKGLDTLRDDNIQIINGIGKLHLQSASGEVAGHREIRQAGTVTADAAAQILDEIARLRELLPSAVATQEAQQQLPDLSTNILLERYLDSATSYAETVYDEMDSYQDSLDGTVHSVNDQEDFARRPPSLERQAHTIPVPVSINLQNPAPVLNAGVLLSLKGRGEPTFTRRVGAPGWAIAILEYELKRIRFYDLTGRNTFYDLTGRNTHDPDSDWLLQGSSLHRPCVARYSERVALNLFRRQNDSSDGICIVTNRGSNNKIKLDLPLGVKHGFLSRGALYSCEGHSFSTDGNMLVVDMQPHSASLNSLIIIWSLIDDVSDEVGAVTKKYQIVSDSEMSFGPYTGRLGLSPDCRRVAKHDSKSLRIWDIGGRNLVRVINWKGIGRISPIFVEMNGTWVAAFWNHWAQKLTICNLDTGEHSMSWPQGLRHLRGKIEAGRWSHSEIVWDGKSMLVAQFVNEDDSGDPDKIQIWNITEERLVCSIRYSMPGYVLRESTLTDDGSYLAAEKWNKKTCIQEGVIVWRIQQEGSDAEVVEF